MMSSRFLRQNRHKHALKEANNSLVAEFQNALITIATIQNSKSQAILSEAEALKKLDSYTKSNNMYLTPRDVPIDDQDILKYSSLDAHLRKVQSKQIENYGTHVISEQEQSILASYKGKKVIIKALNKEERPFNNQWIDRYTGSPYYVENISKSITGIIDDVILSQNLMILSPTIGRKLINKSLNKYYIEVINLNDFLPMITISLVS